MLSCACEYCRCPERYAVQSFECEHIIPLSQGGARLRQSGLCLWRLFVSTLVFHAASNSCTPR